MVRITERVRLVIMLAPVILLSVGIAGMALIGLIYREGRLTMTWREKLNKMAIIDILYMCCDNANKRYGGTCFHDIMTGTVCTECNFDCHKCMENLLNEEVNSQNGQGS